MRYEFPPEVVLKLNGYIQNGELTPTLAGQVENGALKPLLNGYVSRGVKAAEIDENGHLLLTLTDNTVLDLGSAVGPPGEKGDKGNKGADGRGITSVTLKSGTHAAGTTDTYTITFTDGTTADFEVTNGADGAPGENGVSPTITTSKSGKVTTVTVTDATGEHSFEILDGEDGTGSGGDMTAAVYDPQGKAQDIFAYADAKVSEVEQTASDAATAASEAKRQASSAYSAANNAASTASAASRAASRAESAAGAAQHTANGKLSPTGDGSNLTSGIGLAYQRTNLNAGEKLSVMFGKIYRYFADLKALAFKASVEKSDLADDVPLLPDVTASDNGKFLRVVGGAWAAASVPDANGGAF